MCKIMEDMCNDVAQKSRAEERIQNIRNAMDSLKISAQKAMEVLKVPPEEQAKYAAML